jgi:molybdate transport system substrate-binding protein
MRYLVFAVLCAALTLAFSGCPAQPKSAPSAQLPALVQSKLKGAQLRLIADPVLQVPLEKISRQLKREQGLNLALTYLDSKEQRAFSAASKPEADILLYIDKGVTRSLVKAAVIDETSSCVIGGERLVVVCKRGIDWKAQGLNSLSRLRFKTFGLLDAKSVLGAYSEQALKSDGAFPRVQKRIAYYPSQDELTAALKQNPSELGIIYASQAARSKDLDIVVAINSDLHEDIRYRAAAVAGRQSDPAVQALLAALAQGDQIQGILGSYGIVPRTAALKEVR